MTGMIKHMVAGKSFGFIRADDGIEYFFHRDDCEEFDELLMKYLSNDECRVEFVGNSKSPKGPRASEVVVC